MRQAPSIFKGILLMFFLFFIKTSIQAQFVLEIWEIQGANSSSPYNGDFVTTENNVVTAVSDDFFVIQTPDSRADADDQTSNAIYVAWSNPNTIAVGDLVDVEGRIDEDEGLTLFRSSVDIDIIALNQAMPTAVPLNNDFPSTAVLPIHDLEKVEGMIVSLDNAWICGASDDNGWAYIATTAARPAREAGVRYPGLSDDDIPVWDGNPEVIHFVPHVLGLSNNRNLSSGMKISGKGIIYENDDEYMFFPKAYNLTGDDNYRPARTKSATEATIASFNALFFTDNSSAARIEKMSRYVLESMQAPDVIAFQEVESEFILEKLADKIRDLDADAIYTAYLPYSSGTLNLGYLVKNTLTDVKVVELGQNESLSLGGYLHNRPPLRLEGNFNTNPPIPITVLNVHMRSLNGIDWGSDAYYVRTKRHEQAISLANIIKSIQAQGDNLFVVGDFNAFPFSDGYVDVMNQITGAASLGALFEIEPIIEDELINYSLSVDPSEQYSYVYQGNIQILDHCLGVRDLDGMEVNELQYVRGNADSPEVYEGSDALLRASDHDSFVVYLDLKDSLSTVEEELPKSEAAVFAPNPFQRGDKVYFNLNEKQNLTYRLITLDGKILQTGAFDAVEEDAIVLPLPTTLIEGLYLLQIEGRTLDAIMKLYISMP